MKGVSDRAVESMFAACTDLGGRVGQNTSNIDGEIAFLTGAKVVILELLKSLESPLPCFTLSVIGKVVKDVMKLSPQKELHAIIDESRLGWVGLRRLCMNDHDRQ